MASAERLIDVRHFCRNKNRMAEISVPAWPIPIQKTKLVISQAQPTGRLLPHTPIPVLTRYVSMARSEERRVGKECRCGRAPDQSKKATVGSESSTLRPPSTRD